MTTGPSDCGRAVIGAFAALGLAACSAPDERESVVVPDRVATASVSDTRPARAADRELTLNGLAGSFRDAGAGAPAVLIVPGSGPTDRDGNNPMGVAASSYRLLADGLQAAGVSSLRVDKRGMFASAGAGDGNAVTVDLYAQDTLDWAQALRAQTGNGCVHLLGHSEGGMMVSAAAARDNAGICGLILLAVPGRPMADVLREQLRANPANAPILDDAMAAIDRLEAGKRVDVSGLHPALQSLFAPVVQDFVISTYAVDPAELVQRADVPTLVVQGDRDLQVTPEDARRLSANGARLVILPGVNHVLKDAPEDRAKNFATYADPDLPLADGIVAAVADFVESNE